MWGRILSIKITVRRKEKWSKNGGGGRCILEKVTGEMGIREGGLRRKRGMKGPEGSLQALDTGLVVASNGLWCRSHAGNYTLPRREQHESAELSRPKSATSEHLLGNLRARSPALADAFSRLVYIFATKKVLKNHHFWPSKRRFSAYFEGLEGHRRKQLTHYQSLANILKTRSFPTKWSRASKNRLFARLFVKTILHHLLNNSLSSRKL